MVFHLKLYPIVELVSDDAVHHVEHPLPLHQFDHSLIRKVIQQPFVQSPLRADFIHGGGGIDWDVYGLHQVPMDELKKSEEIINRRTYFLSAVEYLLHVDVVALFLWWAVSFHGCVAMHISVSLILEEACQFARWNIDVSRISILSLERSIIVAVIVV